MDHGSDGGAGARAGNAADDGEVESSGRSGFFQRLFRRDQGEGDDAQGGADHSNDARLGNRGNALLVNLRNLREMRVDDVAVPRADLVAVAEDASLAEIVAVFQQSTLSRLPVYRETLDQPVGLVHFKDLALKFGFSANDETFDLAPLLRPLLYAPPSMRIGVLLQKMQAARTHMALVIDEYGGVDGLVTIEDLLEQVVGDISDEHDEDAIPLWTREPSGAYLCQARVDLEDFQEATGVRLIPDDLSEEVDTLGGLVSRLSGRVPARGEVVIHPDGHEFEVVDADARKIKRLRIRLKYDEGRGRPGASERTGDPAHDLDPPRSPEAAGGSGAARRAAE